MNDGIRTQISAFVDGELPDSEADLLLRRMSQDARLRREAAEFLELGRAIRGEASVPGIDRLRERIAVALDHKVPEVPSDGTGNPSGKAIRPLVGVAVAASVALVALFGLQLRPGAGSDGPGPGNAVEVAGDTGYTVPQQPDETDEQLRQYVLSHGASSSEFGANGVNARLVTLRLSEETLAEDESQDPPAADDEAATDDASTQR